MTRNNHASVKSRQGGLSVLELILVGVIAVIVIAMVFFFKSETGGSQTADEAMFDLQSFSDTDLDPLDNRDQDWKRDLNSDDEMDMDFLTDYSTGGSSANTVAISANVRAILEEAIVDGKVSWNQLSQKIKQLPLESMAEAWAFIDALPWSPEKQEVMNELMRSWATANPSDAMEFAEGIGSRRQRGSAFRAITEGWAQSDPESVFAWYIKQAADSETPMPPLSISTLFDGMYSHNKEWALEQVWTLPSTSLQQQALQAMLHEKGEERVQTRDRMLEYFNQLEDEPEKQALLVSAIARSWATFDPAGAATWISEQEDEDLRRKASSELIQRWAYLDPKESMDWLLTQDDEEIQKNSAYSISRRWMSDNPTEFKQWLDDAEPSVARDAAVEGYVRTLTYKNPEEAMNMAASISDESQRHKVTEGVIKTWYSRDKNAAVVAVLNSDLPDSVKRKYAEASLPRTKLRTKLSKNTR